MTAALKATQLLRQAASRTYHAARPSACSTVIPRRAFSSVIPEAPESAMDGSDKSLNRLTRTESIVSTYLSRIITIVAIILVQICM